MEMNGTVRSHRSPRLDYIRKEILMLFFEDKEDFVLELKKMTNQLGERNG